MQTTMILLQKIAEMFLLMAAGFVLFRKGLLGEQGTADIGRLLTLAVIPVILINSLWADRTAEKTAVLVQSAVASALLMALSVAAAVLIFPNDGVSCFGAAFSNAGFIGIPLVQSVLGGDAAFLISAMIVMIGLLQYTVGLVMITGDKGTMKLKAVLKNPVVLSVALGTALYAANIPKPALAASVFSTVGSLNTPLAMLLLGAYLAKTDLKKVFAVRSSYTVSLVRLLLIPLAGALLLRALPLGSSELKLALFITSACPAGSLGAIFAQQYGKDYEKATGQVCISTVLCMASIPLMAALCGGLLQA